MAGVGSRGRALKRRLAPVVNRVRTDPSVRQEIGELQALVRGLRSTIAEFSPTLVDLARPSGGQADDRVKHLARLIAPHTPAGRALIRVGGAGDGGYVMVEDLTAEGAVSLGVGGDISWDKEIAGRGISVAAFDPTVPGLPYPCDGVTFHPMGVTGDEDLGESFEPLMHLVRRAGMQGRRDLLLKMDVEGAEWDALSVLTSTDLMSFRQIVLELHDLSSLTDPQRGDAMLAVIEQLVSTHVPVHVHANNWGRLARFDDLWFPDVIELSLARRDIVPASSARDRVRLPLDAPCDPAVSEIQLEGMLGA